MSAGDWCLIESDPGVFTELIKGFGVQGLQVEELWSLDEESFEQLRPVHGLVFLYKWRAEDEPQGSIVQDSRLEEIFFAKQVIHNACATQAIVSVLLNTKHSDIDFGPVLTEFKDFAISFDPANRGLALTNSEQIRKVHNSFSRQQMFEFDDKLSKNEDTFHFVAYLPINGRLYELDGLREGPIDLGKCDQDDWLKAVKPVLDKRIQSFAADEIHFNLMAIVSDRRMIYEKEIAELEKRKEQAAQRIQVLLNGGEPMEEGGGGGGGGGGGLPSDPEQLHAVILEVEERVGSLRDNIVREEAKMEKYRLENVRRKHNYLPLIMEVLKLLAKRGELVQLVKQAKEKKAEQREAEEKKKKEKEGETAKA